MAAQDWEPGPGLSAPASPRRSAASRTGSRTSPSAARWYDEALAIWRELGDKREIANALYNRAYADIMPLMGLSGAS